MLNSNSNNGLVCCSTVMFGTQLNWDQQFNMDSKPLQHSWRPPGFKLETCDTKCTTIQPLDHCPLLRVNIFTDILISAFDIALCRILKISRNRNIYKVPNKRRMGLDP